MADKELTPKDPKNREQNAYEVGKGKPPKEHQFTSENQPERRGRKKSKLKGLIETNDLSSTDISDLVLMLVDKTKEELEILSSDETQPFLVRAFVKSMIKDIDDNSLYNINNLLDRAIGKPKEKKETKHTTLDEDGNEIGMNINIEFTGE